MRFVQDQSMFFSGSVNAQRFQNNRTFGLLLTTRMEQGFTGPIKERAESIFVAGPFPQKIGNKVNFDDLLTETGH
jgi:hypothetical protein